MHGVGSAGLTRTSRCPLVVDGCLRKACSGTAADLLLFWPDPDKWLALVRLRKCRLQRIRSVLPRHTVQAWQVDTQEVCWVSNCILQRGTVTANQEGGCCIRTSHQKAKSWSRSFKGLWHYPATGVRDWALVYTNPISPGLAPLPLWNEVRMQAHFYFF